jgi:hypothetical protein
MLAQYPQRLPDLVRTCSRTVRSGTLLEPPSRSAFLKEWGRVKVLVLVAALGVVNAGAGGS